MPNVIKFEGIEGESQLADHVGWIEIGPFNLSAGHGYSGLGTGGSSGGKLEFSPIQISKKRDKASIPLLNRSTFGKPFETVEIHSLKTTGQKLEKFAGVKVWDVFISAYGDHNNGDDTDHLSEGWTLNFKKIEITHSVQAESGVTGPEDVFTIDLREYK